MTAHKLKRFWGLAIFPIALLCAVFLLPKFANAEDITLKDQDVESQQSSTGSNDGFTQTLGNDLQGELSKIEFSVSVNGAGLGGPVVARVHCYEDASYVVDCYSNDGTNTWTSAQSADVSGSSSRHIEFVFPGGKTFVPAYYYKIEVQGLGWNNFGGVYMHTYGSPTDTYADGSADGAGIGTIDDLYFKLYILGPIYFANPPFRPDMVTTDFIYWRYCVNPTGLTATDFSVSFQYGDTLSEFEDDHSMDEMSLPGTVNCNTIAKIDDLTPGTKVARVNLYLDGVPFASSSILNFEVVAGEKTNYPVDLGGVSEPEIFECAEGNIIATTFCKAMVFLFVPGEGSTALITEAYADLSGTFPFAYVTDVTDSISNLEEGDGEAASLTIDMSETALPIGGEEGFDLFSEDRIGEYLGGGNLALFRGLMAGALWIGLGFYVFHRAGGLH